jgi:hypothetical protein
MAKTNEYPEHNKLQVIKDRSQPIGEFLVWLAETKHLEICERIGSHNDYLQPITQKSQELLAEYFDIDLERLEKEKRMMLDELRKEAG